MNKITKLTVAALLGTAMLTSTASADVKKGQKLYLKKLKAPCGISGAKFAHKHTQDEWEAIHEAGKFADEVKKICPKVKKVKEKYVPHIYDFAYEYAKDSGNVPSC
ncbi:cytochrome C [Sulfurovum sp.]|uniref:cytochrome C n=1 Tax=Sulfurovum sp. TaxID=1969726 RepID=UPI0028683671|nr:cytochrome C [Sulfurovum sp.]